MCLFLSPSPILSCLMSVSQFLSVSIYHSVCLLFVSMSVNHVSALLFVFKLMLIVLICCMFSLSSSSGNLVTIAGTPCDVQSESETQIVCRTGEHKPSEKTKVRVEVGDNGIALQVGLCGSNVDF